WGRRPTLLLGTVLISIFYLILALMMRSYEAIQTNNMSGVLFHLDSLSMGIASICMVYLVVASFAFSWGPCGWLVPSEIFPTHIRVRATSVTTGTNWISNFVITLTSPILLEHAGWRLFCAFSIIMAMNFIVIYCFLPETKGLTLEEMDSLFSGSVWAFKSPKKSHRMSFETTLTGEEDKPEARPAA
ncbi:hypothetical protein FBU59_000845, partial [Linderina macrospora]